MGYLQLLKEWPVIPQLLQWVKLCRWLKVLLLGAGMVYTLALALALALAKVNLLQHFMREVVRVSDWIFNFS